ncbi:tRNA N6-adenosine threonylcarbamoyltransferase, mitochondrial isoform X3 [Erinaceus europaeus]|uniref:N(6)-L-threonylcarbamoyladenine synthase n=1 Tax=Erinaceus europaeus TaxID=9365 RepID=A0ABM3WAG3_ERIEU|nr:tRNA N6-adenosine threonylcarbamoyltransferase, mitochondrial isoform X3 [Erinaceus europaeus]
MLILNKTAGVFFKPSKRKICEFLRNFNYHPGKLFLHKVVLGIETSCDDTAAAVVDETGDVLGEAIHSQTQVHLKTGGIIPPVAQQLHREHIARIVQEALSASQVSPSELSAVATTVKPGLALSLGVGLSFSLQLVAQLRKPFIPIHHMEAHALTVRLTSAVDFPFLALLISGGHCLLALARGVSDFLLLGQSLDIAPGDMLDKVARRLSLMNHPECSAMSGGEALEHLAKQGNKLSFDLKPPMQRAKNCDFSFSGLQHVVDKLVMQKEKEEGCIWRCCKQFIYPESSGSRDERHRVHSVVSASQPVHRQRHYDRLVSPWSRHIKRCCGSCHQNTTLKNGDLTFAFQKALKRTQNEMRASQIPSTPSSLCP